MSRRVVVALAMGILVIETSDIIPQRLICFLVYYREIVGSVHPA